MSYFQQAADCCPRSVVGVLAEIRVGEALLPALVVFGRLKLKCPTRNFLCPYLAAPGLDGIQVYDRMYQQKFFFTGHASGQSGAFFG